MEKRRIFTTKFKRSSYNYYLKNSSQPYVKQERLKMKMVKIHEPIVSDQVETNSDKANQSSGIFKSSTQNTFKWA